MSKTDFSVAVYATHGQAETSVKPPHKAELDVKGISLLGTNHHTEAHGVGYLNAGDGAKFLGTRGVFRGGLAGILCGSAMMLDPVVGHMVVLGPVAATAFGGLQGAVLGGGALVGARGAPSALSAANETSCPTGPRV